MAGGRRLPIGKDTNERLPGISLRQGLAQIRGRGPVGQLDVDRGKNAAAHRHEMRGEIDDDGPAGGLAQPLLDLRRMAMAGDAIGMDTLGHLGEEILLLGVAPRPGHPGLGVDDDVVAGDPAGFEQRDQRQLGGGGIAAGIGHQPRLRHRGARQLRQAIDGLFLQRRRAMGMAIPGRVALEVGEAEIGGEIDDLQRAGQARDHLLGRAMGQAAEDEIDLRPVGLLDLDEARQIEPAQMGKDLRQRLAGLAIGSQQADLDPGMKGQKAQQLGSGIAAGPENADPDLVRRRHVALLRPSLSLPSTQNSLQHPLVALHRRDQDRRPVEDERDILRFRLILNILIAAGQDKGIGQPRRNTGIQLRRAEDPDAVREGELRIPCRLGEGGDAGQHGASLRPEAEDGLELIEIGGDHHRRQDADGGPPRVHIVDHLHNRSPRRDLGRDMPLALQHQGGEIGGRCRGRAAHPERLGGANLRPCPKGVAPGGEERHGVSVHELGDRGHILDPDIGLGAKLRGHDIDADEADILIVRLEHRMDRVEPALAGSRPQHDLAIQQLLQTGAEEIEDGPDEGGPSHRHEQPQTFHCRRPRGPQRRQACRQGKAR